MPIVLTENDAKILRELISREKQKIPNHKKQYGLEEDITAPEVYIAKTPPEGIAGVNDGVGTASDSAECAVYQLLDDLTIEDTGLVQDVYNLSSSNILGDVWVLISRDKYGSWIATSFSRTDSTQWVTIEDLTTVTTSAGFCYPGYTWIFRPADSTWVAGDPCWVLPLNDATVSLDTYYQARYVGEIEDTGTGNWPVYRMYTGKSEVVKVTGPAVAGVYPGLLQKYNAGTWVDANAVDVIEINGANLSGWGEGANNWGED